MASNHKISTAARNAACDAVVDLIDGGSGAGYVRIYTGSPPTNVSDSPSGTLLGTLTCSDPAFGSSSNGIATAQSVTSDSSADATGTAGWYRVFDSNGVAIMQGTAGNAASSSDMTLANAAIVSGGTISITSWTVTMPIS